MLNSHATYVLTSSDLNDAFHKVVRVIKDSDAVQNVLVGLWRSSELTVERGEIRSVYPLESLPGADGPSFAAVLTHRAKRELRSDHRWRKAEREVIDAMTPHNIEQVASRAWRRNDSDSSKRKAKPAASTDNDTPFLLACLAEQHAQTFRYIARCAQHAVRQNFEARLCADGACVWNQVNGRNHAQVVRHHRAFIRICGRFIQKTPRLRRLAADKTRSPRFMARIVQRRGLQVAMMAVTGIAA